jgi:hypothetical protein
MILFIITAVKTLNPTYLDDNLYLILIQTVFRKNEPYQNIRRGDDNLGDPE